MGSVSVKISGADRARFKKDIKNFEKAFSFTSGQALDAVALEIRLGAIKILDSQKTSDTGILKNSIKVTKGFRMSRRVETQSGYGLYVEFGRSSGNMPPVKSIIPWVRRKLGIRNPIIAKRIAYAIAKGIGERGTKAQPFLRPAYERGIKRMVTAYRKEFAKQK